MKKIDFHVHILNQIPVEDTVKNFSDMCDRKGYEGVVIQTLCHATDGSDLLANEKALQIISAMPNSYAFASLKYDENFVEQTKKYMSLGFRGIKLLNGKPTEYKYSGLGIEHERFAPFFEFCEKEQFPVLIHNNDPAMHWDITKASKRAIEKGWVYDETFPSHKYLFEALEKTLERFPHLKVALAHLGFYSNNLYKAEELLECFPNLYFDITPALIIYSELSQAPELSNAFFTKYHDRLIYGTDAENDLVGKARAYNDLKTEIITHFLEGEGSRDIGEYHICPIKLEQYMLQNIYYNNAKKFMNI